MLDSTCQAWWPAYCRLEPDMWSGHTSPAHCCSNTACTRRASSPRRHKCCHLLTRTIPRPLRAAWYLLLGMLQEWGRECNNQGQWLTLKITTYKNIISISCDTSHKTNFCMNLSPFHWWLKGYNNSCDLVSGVRIYPGMTSLNLSINVGSNLDNVFFKGYIHLQCLHMVKGVCHKHVKPIFFIIKYLLIYFDNHWNNECQAHWNDWMNMRVHTISITEKQTFVDLLHLYDW